MHTFTLRAYAWIMVGLSSARNRLSDARGQDLIEYALLGGLIAAAIIAAAALGGLTGAIGDMADGIGGCIDFDSSTGCTGPG